MALRSITLLDGVTVGSETHRQVELVELTAGDVIDANAEAEQVRVVSIGGAPEATVVVSPCLVGIHTLRRQIKRLGDLKGPIGLEVMRKLSARDFNVLMAEAQLIGGAVGQAASAQGRDDARPACD